MTIQSSPSSFTADPHHDEYRLADVSFYLAEDNHALVYAKSTDATSILHTAYVDLLKHCHEFRTLNTHIATFCQDRQVSERIKQGLQYKLQYLAQEGYLISRCQACLEDATSSAHSRSEISGITYKLPNGLPIALQDSRSFINNALSTYNEVFRLEIYLKHGIELNRGDCIMLYAMRAR